MQSSINRDLDHRSINQVSGLERFEHGLSVRALLVTYIAFLYVMLSERLQGTLRSSRLLIVRTVVS